MLVRSGSIDLIVIDSVAALVPRAEIEGEMGDSHVGLQARLMSQALRKLTGGLSQTNTTMIFINQLREKIGVFFGSPETTAGGKALKFYASVRLDIRRIETLKDGTDAVGNRTRVKVVKNKMAPPFKQAEFDILYGIGISREGSLIDFGVEHGIVKKSGAWYTYDGDQLGQGKENSRNFLLKNPDIATRDRDQDPGKLGIGAVGPPQRRRRPRRPQPMPRPACARRGRAARREAEGPQGRLGSTSSWRSDGGAAALPAQRRSVENHDGDADVATRRRGAGRAARSAGPAPVEPVPSRSSRSHAAERTAAPDAGRAPSTGARTLGHGQHLPGRRRGSMLPSGIDRPRSDVLVAPNAARRRRLDDDGEPVVIASPAIGPPSTATMRRARPSSRPGRSGERAHREARQARPLHREADISTNGLPAEQLEESIERNERLGYLDDVRLAEQLVDQPRRRKGLGRSSIRRELGRRKIDPIVISEALEESDRRRAERARRAGRQARRQLSASTRRPPNGA